MHGFATLLGRRMVPGGLGREQMFSYIQQPAGSEGLEEEVA